jgi:hypothetical protein
MNANELNARIAELRQYQEAFRQAKAVIAVQPAGAGALAEIWRTIADSLKDGEIDVELELKTLKKLQAAGVVK